MGKHLAKRFDPAAGPKRILALDGGGVKGVLSLGMLKAIETELRGRSGDPNFVLSDYYDLIGGTSTGAIIAAGLALGKTVDELIALYLKLGPDVFGQRSRSLLGFKFDSKRLRTALQGVLGRRTLGSPDLKTGLAIHAKRIDTGSAWVLTNNPKAKFFDPEDPDPGVVPNKKYRLVDIVQASAAAPTYFDEVRIPIVYDERDRVASFGYFVDGAVSANNNPSIQLLMLALIPSYGFSWQCGPDLLMMTSVGTGMRRPTIGWKEFKDKIPALRAVHALKSMIYDTQMQGILVLQALSESKRPWHMNAELGDMSGERLANTTLLDYQRIDVRLDPKPKTRRPRDPAPPTEVENLIRRELDAKTIDGLDLLDNGQVENLNLLLEIGLAAGRLYAGDQYPDPKFDPPEWSRAAVTPGAPAQPMKA